MVEHGSSFTPRILLYALQMLRYALERCSLIFIYYYSLFFDIAEYNSSPPMIDEWQTTAYFAKLYCPVIVLSVSLFIILLNPLCPLYFNNTWVKLTLLYCPIEFSIFFRYSDIRYFFRVLLSTNLLIQHV